MRHPLATLGFACAFLLLGCSANVPAEDGGGPTDAGGSRDAGVPDASTPDAGTPDAGTPDAGSTDAGGDAGMDAGDGDGGPGDGGAPDASSPFPALGVYTVQVDGGDLRLLVDSGTQELSHVRPLPGTDWLTATRYTDDYDGDGVAREGERVNGQYQAYYLGTEIVVFRLSAPTQVSVVCPAQAGLLCANSSWTGDAELLYLHTDVVNDPTSAHFERARFAPIPTVAGVARVPIPTSLLIPVDPHQHGSTDGGFIVFSAHFQAPAGWMRPVWRMPATGTSNLTEVQVVGCPLCPAQGGCCGFAQLGDVLGTNDARINHAGTAVGWMQQHPFISFGVPPAYPYLPWVRTLASPTPLSLAPANRPATTSLAYPEWRPDDLELVHWAVEVEDGHVRENLYSLAPDGTNEQRIPLPPGLCATHPSYLDQTTIVFNGYRCP